MTQMEGTGAFMQVETIRAFTETIMEITYRGIHVEKVGDNDIQIDKVRWTAEGRGRGRGERKMGDGAKVILFPSVGFHSSTLKSPTPELRRGSFKKFFLLIKSK